MIQSLCHARSSPTSHSTGAGRYTSSPPLLGPIFCLVSAIRPGGSHVLPARPILRKVEPMDTIDGRILDVLRSRASWNRGNCSMSVPELADILTSRFPKDDRPTREQVRSTVRRLARSYKLRWARIDERDVIHFLAG